MRDLATGRWRDWRRAAAPWFVLPGAVAALAVGVINVRLHGSPLRSGYDLNEAYALAYVLPNLGRYVWWLVTAETPFALAGLFGLAMWLAGVRRTRGSRSACSLLASCAAVVWISYLLYVPWDAWWYLRFLLPAWPMMAIGTALLLAMLFRSRAGA